MNQDQIEFLEEVGFYAPLCFTLVALIFLSLYWRFGKDAMFGGMALISAGMVPISAAVGFIPAVHRHKETRRSGRGAG